VAESLVLLDERACDLLICDVNLPGTDGLALLRAVRSSFASTAVILTTADRDMDRAVSAFRLGAFDYLKKPIRTEELLDCVARVAQAGRAGPVSQ
jgi:two-component system nitrogen regulation response regulator GlnG